MFREEFVQCAKTCGSIKEYLEKAEWRALIGPDPARYCALIGWDHSVATPALLCHIDTAQGTLISCLELCLYDMLEPGVAT